MQLHQYGPGDEITWEPCTGHPLDPRTDDGDFITQWEATDAATDELLATPEFVAQWLNGHCETHADPVQLRFGRDVDGLNVPALLATLMAGSKQQIHAAALALRDFFRDDCREQIEERAREIFVDRNGSDE